MSKCVTIVDYGIGNLWSVRSALRYLGHDSVVSSTPSEVVQADALILPGVGSFRKAMAALRNSQLDEAIIEATAGRGRKILGICLGMQLLAMRSTEDGETSGLGLISADVERFDSVPMGRLKVPHVGFNKVSSHEQSVLFRGIASSADFYFVHSYRLLADGLEGRHGICHYGQDFLAAYEHENIFATQFHPEKSQTNGLMLIKNFMSY
jgi:imidazole glycerol-phosphate synthase subunit HisH